ncbi:MAG: DUF523 domain-containing protein [Desulfobacteraceae bacterium]|nr:MAG: DUF523 domain-containing protein [Desulfobacteraceae bacterium]
MKVREPFAEKNSPIMISACLLGIHCRYDGWHSLCPDLADFVISVSFIPFCPEQLGGLPTPRPPANITGGDGRDILLGGANVVNGSEEDVTDSFNKGAQEALRLAALAGATFAIMKDKSPSCGLITPYCEKSSGLGIGVTAALFEMHNIKVYKLVP